jgi:hypothetical protein
MADLAAVEARLCTPQKVALAKFDALSIRAPSKRTFRRFIILFPGILSRLSNADVVAQSFSDAGLVPPCLERVLGPWPGLELLTESEVKRVYSAIKGPFLNHFAVFGLLPEQLIATELRFLGYKHVIRENKFIEQLVLNRGNSMSLLNAHVIADEFKRVQAKRLALALAEAAAEERKIAAELKRKNSVSVMYIYFSIFKVYIYLNIILYTTKPNMH